MTTAETQLPVLTVVRDWLRTDGRLWLFVFKTCLSGLLALWIAFRLGFDQPSTAMTTVFIVAQPQSGLVLAKSFYRVIGTLVGLVVTIALVAFFAQYRELFLIAISLWIGVCVFGAYWFRDFQAYAFLLAGYTSCLIGFPGVIHPDAVFETAVTRVSEIMLGILCVTVISDALFPEQLSPRLVQTVRGQFSHFIRFLHQAVATPLDRSVTVSEQLQFVSDVLTLESLRASTLFESGEARIRSDRLRLFNADFMAVSTTLHALQRLAQRLRAVGHLQALAELRPCVDSLAPALLFQGRAPAMAAEAGQVVTQLQEFRATLALSLRSAHERLLEQTSASEVFDFDCTAELFEQFVDELHRFTDTYASLATLRTRVTRKAPRLVLHTEPVEAAISGVRATLVMLVLTIFWISTAWPEGAGAATIAAVCCMLFASAPNPMRAVRQMGSGFVIGLLAAYVCGFHVLNQLDGFTQLGFGMLPFMMIGAWLVGHPKWAGIGAGFNIMFSSSLAPQNVMGFNAVGFLNNGIAQLIGVAAAGIAFSILMRDDPQAIESRIAHRLRRELELACTDSLRELPHAFDGRLRDLMRRLLALPEGTRERLLACALSVLELGDGIVELRSVVATQLPAALQPGLKRILHSLTRCCQRPTPKRRQEILAMLRRYVGEVEASLHLQAYGAQELQACARLQRCLHRIYSGLADDDWYAAFTVQPSLRQDLSQEEALDAT